jgi:glycosyltransferase involved in cell wall biosynthesis
VRPLNILIWHVHGSWTTSFVQGPHRYLLPVDDARSAAGAGRARTWTWPESAVEVPYKDGPSTDVDVVVLQRVEDEDLATRWLGGRVPGRDVPAVWLEHNAPQGRIADMLHPAADRDDLVVVHVTATNALFWDTGSTPVRVIEHGVIDPGHRFTGALARAAIVVNDPVRRGRVTGTDLLARFARVTPVDIFGMRVERLAETGWYSPSRVTLHEDLPQDHLHELMAMRRAYVHPFRWTSLGLSLVEAMHLGMPVVALATTETPDVVPSEAGFVSNRMDVLLDGLRLLMADRELAQQMGKAARAAAIERHGIERFLREWDQVLEEVTA